MEGMRLNAANRQAAGGDLARATLGANIEDERLRRGAYNQVRQQNQLMQARCTQAIRWLMQHLTLQGHEALWALAS